jgi:hypothetical protein
LTLQETLGSSIPVIVLAWIAGRLLGVRHSLPKALLARFLGWPAGSSVIAIEIPYGSAGPAVLTGPDPFVVALILTMALFVLFELIGRPGSMGWVQPGFAGIPAAPGPRRRRGVELASIVDGAGAWPGPGCGRAVRPRRAAAGRAGRRRSRSRSRVRHPALRVPDDLTACNLAAKLRQRPARERNRSVA